jgi:hypothetical protein
MMKRREEPEKFVSKRVFAMPQETFVEMDISEEQRVKILKWIDAGDIIGVFPYATGLPRLVLTNQTKLDKWNKKKKKQ